VLRGGALGGIRTPNLLIRSQMLYPLSYERLAPRLGESSRRSSPGETGDGWGAERSLTAVGIRAWRAVVCGVGSHPDPAGPLQPDPRTVSGYVRPDSGHCGVE
jgi:hypothetical protein